MSTRTVIARGQARRAKFTSDTPIQHACYPDAPKAKSFEGQRIGNYEGHFRGLEITKFSDDTFSIVLRADFVDRWERVPTAAVEFEGLELTPEPCCDECRQGFPCACEDHL